MGIWLVCHRVAPLLIQTRPAHLFFCYHCPPSILCLQTKESPAVCIKAAGNHSEGSEDPFYSQQQLPVCE